MIDHWFVDWRTSEDGAGREPAVPDAAVAILRAGLRGADWAVFRCDFAGEGPADGACQPVPAELDRLLCSAEGYPPAMALASHRVERAFRDEHPSRLEFADVYASLLRELLDAQAEAPYVLVRTLRDELGYKTTGEYRWIVGVTGDDPPLVHWVSDDYAIYSDPASDFALTEEQLRRLLAASRR